MKPKPKKTARPNPNFERIMEGLNEAAGEELMSDRIAEQQAQLDALTQRREELLQGRE